MARDPRSNGAAVETAARSGMTLSLWADWTPDRELVRSPLERRTCAELNANANRLVRVLRRAGLRPGDAFAVLLSNRPAIVEAWAAAQRSGLRMTPVNWHLKGEEVGYVVDNCEAKAFLSEPRFAETAVEAAAAVPRLGPKLAVGGGVPGFASYEEALAAEDGSDIPDPTYGNYMLYTSGTTGRPKGVYRPDREPLLPQYEGTEADFRPYEDVGLCTGPAYHAAPLMSVARALVSGVPVVFMDKWDAEETLRLIDRHRVTHTHMVATMFHRLLRLPEDVRRRYDVSSMRMILHGAAPCPVHVKQAMIEWFGPVLWEYYAATEGANGFLVGSEEWLCKPGTVGRPGPEFDNRILDEEGREVATGEVGTIYMKAPDTGRFRYFKDPDKTAGSYRGEYFTLGDMGYFDEDGYLFLTGRTAELIISGGVNIYPHEVDEVLLLHPAIADVCTVGVPDEEWGEQVKAVVQLRDAAGASEDTAAELIAFARERLPHYKCPRSVDFVTELPRMASGKIQRRTVRAPYWAGREKQI